ncbi:hypothetical protein ACFL6P_01450 [Candidatus Latescibacterota bacterium]
MTNNIPINRKLPKCEYVNLSNRLLNSDAFWTLSTNAIRVLLIFYMKRRFYKKSYAKSKRIPTNFVINNGEITFSYNEAEAYGIKSDTFRRAIDKLLEVGFIDINILGTQRRMTKYSISNRWEKYNTSEFQIKERRKRKNYKPGEGTRFKKRIRRTRNILKAN